MTSYTPSVTDQYPFVSALCPTFRHPGLLANSLALWLVQDYPITRRELVILDDEPTFDEQRGEGYRLLAQSRRMPSLPAKYNLLLEEMRPDTDIVLVWEDDDLYLPSYVSSHVEALTETVGAEYSHPSQVYSDYTGKIALEPASGRFHASMAFTAELIRRIEGWPDTKRADFDQQLITKLRQSATATVDPYEDDPEKAQYVYGWHTGSAHCQSTMRSPDDVTWYDRAPDAYDLVDFVGRLEPKIDGRTRRILGGFGFKVNKNQDVTYKPWQEQRNS